MLRVENKVVQGGDLAEWVSYVVTMQLQGGDLQSGSISRNGFKLLCCLVVPGFYTLRRPLSS